MRLCLTLTARESRNHTFRGKEDKQKLWFVLHIVEVINYDSGRESYYSPFRQWWQFNSIWLYWVTYGVQRHWKGLFIKMINKVSFHPWLQGCDQKSKATRNHLVGPPGRGEPTWDCLHLKWASLNGPSLSRSALSKVCVQECVRTGAGGVDVRAEGRILVLLKTPLSGNPILYRF